MITGPCPKCGKPLNIPEELAEFSCMYCGERLTRKALLGDRQAELQTLCDGIGACVTGHKDTIRYLTPKLYTPHYESYKAQHEGLLAGLDTLASSHHEVLANALLDAIDTRAAGKDSLLEDAKYTLCLLFIPAVRQLAPWQGLRFCETVRRLWLERHPRHLFQLTTYEDIASGFDRKKLCFITTAVCTYQGKSDDCAELTAFRTFRDGWLSRQSDGEALIRRYYDIAPGIVTAIQVTDPDRLFPAIWARWLQPCYDALLRGDFFTCKTLYVDMVDSLWGKYQQ